MTAIPCLIALVDVIYSNVIINVIICLIARRGRRPGKRLEEDPGEDGYIVNGEEAERQFTDEELARFLCTDPNCFQVIYC